MTAVAVPLPPLPDLTAPRDRRTLVAADGWVAAVVAVATFALYFRGRHFDGVRSDDPLYLTANWAVQRGLSVATVRYAWHAVVSSNWHPLTLLTEMAWVSLFGADPGRFHLLTAGLHAANVALVYVLLVTATGRPGRGLAVAALWGLHPLRVESVAWISELKDVLCGFLSLLTLIGFVQYRRAGTAKRAAWWYAGAVVAFALALLAKPMAVTLPFVMLLMDAWPLGRGDGRDGSAAGPAGWWARRVAEQLPMLALAIASSAATLYTQHMTGATQSLEEFTIPTRLATAAAAYWEYLRSTVWPADLCFFYPHPQMLGRAVPWPQWVTGTAVLLGGTAVAVRARRSSPWALVGWLWFVGMLVPVIGLVQVGQMSRADRYTYLPAIGLTLVAVWAAADLAARFRPAGPPVAAAVAVVLAAALALGSYRQLGYWQDDYTLAAHAAEAVPDNYRALDSLALAAIDRGDADERDDRPADAGVDRREAVRLATVGMRLAPGSQETHHTLARALSDDGQLQQARVEFEAALRLDPRHPYIHDNYGNLLVRLGDNADAERQFRIAVRLDPDLATGHSNLGVMLAAQGKLPEAIRQFQIAVLLNPNFGGAHALLAEALQLHGDGDAAVAEYRRAVAVGYRRPDSEANLVWLVAEDAGSSPADLRSLIPVGQDAAGKSTAAQPFPPYANSVLLARLGAFDAAIANATVALERARAAKPPQPALVDAIVRRLAAYQVGLPATRPTTRATTTAAAAASADGRATARVPSSQP